MTPLLLFALALLGLPSPAPESAGTAGNLSGRVSLSKGGAPRADASGAVVWIEKLRLPAGGARTAGIAGAEMMSYRKKFVPRVVAVSRNSEVAFPNADPIFHNVFSVSPANRFDLGLYRSGSSKSRRFEEPGLVRVYCNIHPQMVGFVFVVDSDFAAVTGQDGAFRFENVPPGNWEVKAWHEEGGETQASVTVRARADTPVALSLDASEYRPQAHKNKYGKDYPPQTASDDSRY
jgi:plastocyanin